MKKMNKKGFTIVELVIVIAVIAILAAVLIPTFTGVVDKANESKAMQEARNAWTNASVKWLATPDTTDDVKEASIKSGKYYFYVTNGQFQPAVEETAKTGEGVKAYTVTNGALVDDAAEGDQTQND